MSASFTPHDDCGIEEEIEALKSIYVRELEVKHDSRGEYPVIIELNLHPATADNTDEQYVRLTLIIKIPKTYPESLPSFEIRNPRGLSDEDVDTIVGNLQTKATTSRGSPMLYELIELVKEHLTVGNTPRCSCVICLYGFSDEDAFIRTECYHYFHSHCLRRYIEYVIAESKTVAKSPLDKDEVDSDGVKVLCPVCREAIKYDLNALRAPPPIHVESASDFNRGTDLIRLQKQMAEGFSRQKSRGGIIDVEAEKNKFLLEISAVPAEFDRRSARGSRQRSEVGSDRGNRWKKPQRKSADDDRTFGDDGKANGDTVKGSSSENAEAKDSKESYRGSGRPSNRTNRNRGVGRGERRWGTNRFGRGANVASDKGGSSQKSATNAAPQNGIAQTLTSEMNLESNVNAQRDGFCSKSNRSDRGGSVSRGRGQRGRSQNGYRKRTDVSDYRTTRPDFNKSEQKRVENIVDELACEFSELNNSRTNSKSNDYRVRNSDREVYGPDRGRRGGSATSSNRYRGRFTKNSSDFREVRLDETKPSSSTNISNKVSSDFESNAAAFVQLHERMVLTGPPCKTFSGSFSKPPPGFGPKMSTPPGFNES